MYIKMELKLKKISEPNDLHEKNLALSPIQ